MGPRALLGLLLATGVALGGELFNDKVAIVDPFPREVGRGKTLVIRGTCRGSYKTPELILIAPRGKTYLNGEQEIVGPAFKFTVRFEEGAGPYRLELIAHAPNATRSAARFTIYHGVPKPEAEPEEPPPTGPRTPFGLHGQVLGKRFLATLNEFRKGIGVEPVGWNEAVAARAREHAEHMAEALRRQHRFGGDGVVEMLKADGAGPSGLYGPATAWQRVDSLRPFPPPAPGFPGPKVWNHVVVQNVSGDSLEEVFERHFVREAAFRICAADPHCLEIGVGAAHIATSPPVPGKPPPPGGSTIFYCVCFVQVNDKTLVRAQDDAYDALFRLGRDKNPDVLRALGEWGRPKAAKLLDAALDDKRPEIAAAAWDGLLLLDEDKARAEFARRTQPFANALAQNRYSDAVAIFEPFRPVQFDGSIALTYDNAVREAQAAAFRELGTIARAPEEEREKLAEDLRRRAKGLGIDEQIDKALAKS